MEGALHPREPERLPRGRHGLPRAFVIANQRDRILDAMAQEVADNGYVAVTVADVIARAGVSSKTFYELFRDKTECFLAAYDTAIELLMAHVATVLDEMPERTPQRARAVLSTVLELFAAEPEFARMCIVEVSAAGPEAIRRYAGVIESFLPLLDNIAHYEAARRHQSPVTVDLVMRKALVGGVAWVIHDRIVAGEPERLPELVPELTYFVLVPFLGEEAAAAVAYERPVASKN